MVSVQGGVVGCRRGCGRSYFLPDGNVHVFNENGLIIKMNKDTEIKGVLSVESFGHFFSIRKQ